MSQFIITNLLTLLTDNLHRAMNLLLQKGQIAQVQEILVSALNVSWETKDLEYLSTTLTVYNIPTATNGDRKRSCDGTVTAGPPIATVTPLLAVWSHWACSGRKAWATLMT